MKSKWIVYNSELDGWKIRDLRFVRCDLDFATVWLVSGTVAHENIRLGQRIEFCMVNFNYAK